MSDYLNPNFVDMLSAFADAGVEYLLIGGYALGAHGHPRATKDIDLWVRPDPDNAKRVMEALRIFGAPMAQISEEDFRQPNVIFQIGLPPQRIDILTSLDAVGFDEAWEERLEVTIELVPVTVIGREHLIRNKRAAGRLQDLADVESLEK